MINKRREQVVKQRIQYLDIMKGITILLVIIGHYIPWQLLRVLIWSFHMPLFVFVSGYFFRNMPFTQRVKKAAENYLVPYWIVCFVVMLFELLYYGYRNRMLQEHTSLLWIAGRRLLSGICVFASNGGVPFKPQAIPRIGATWFLAALFVGEIYMVCLLKIRKEWIRITIIIVSVLFSAWLVTWTWIPCALHYGTAFMGWLYCGYCFRRGQYLSSSLKLCKFWNYFVCALIWLMAVLMEYHTGNMYDINRLKFPLFGLELAGALCGILFMKFVSQMIAVYIRIIADLLAFLGRNTIWILCVHSIDQEIYSYMWNRVFLSSAITQPVRMAADLLIAVICASTYNYIRKEKKRGGGVMASIINCGKQRLLCSNLNKAVMLNLFICVLLFMFFDPMTKLDDYVMDGILNGAIDGSYSPFILYSHVFLGYILVFLLRLLPDVKWFYYIQYVGVFIGFTVVSYIILKRRKEKRTFCYLMLLLLFAGYDFYIRMTFTKTAGILIIAGMLLLLYLIDYGWVFNMQWVLSLLLIAAGTLFRATVCNMVLLVFFSTFIIINLKNIMIKEKVPLKKNLLFMVMAVAIFVGQWELSNINISIYRSDELWHDYYENNAKRANLADYGWPDYNEFQEQYEQLGISENDFKLYSTNTLQDSYAFSVETREKVIGLKKMNPASFWKMLNGATKYWIHYLMGEPVFYIFLILFLGEMIWGDKRNIIFIFIVWANAFCAYLVMYKQGRLAHHVDVSLFFAAFVISWYFSDGKGKVCEKRFWERFALLGLIAFVCFNKFYNQLGSLTFIKNSYVPILWGQKEQQVRNEKRLSLLSEDVGHYYIVNDVDTVNNGFYPLYPGSWGNIVSSTMIVYPPYQNQFKTYQIENMWRDLVYKGNLYFAFTDSSLRYKTSITTFLREHYAEHVRAVKVKELEGWYIYQFDNGNLRIDEESISDDHGSLEKSVSYSMGRRTLEVDGYVFAKGEDSYAQQIYVETEDIDTKSRKYFYATQKENCLYAKESKYNGKYSSFTSKIRLKDLNHISRTKISVILKSGEDWYRIPVERNEDIQKKYAP